MRGKLLGICGVAIGFALIPAAVTAQVEAAPAFPQWQPGQYEVLKTLISVSGNVPQDMKDRPAQNETHKGVMCYPAVRHEERSPSIMDMLRIGDDCKVVKASADGTHMKGLLDCADAQTVGTIAYEGTYTDTSADITITAMARPASGGEPMNLTGRIQVRRVADKCTSSQD